MAQQQRWSTAPVQSTRGRDDNTSATTRQGKVGSSAGHRALRHALSARSRALVAVRTTPPGPVLTRGLLDPFLRLAGNLTSYERNLLHRCTFTCLFPQIHPVVSVEVVQVSSATDLICS
jgi:hypothetical protein